MQAKVEQKEQPDKGFLLVVDDDHDLNMTLCDILVMNDYNVKSALNGQEALAILANERPDIILSDISMPVMDGHALLKHTRADPNLHGLPFIFLTSHASIEDQRAALTVGIEDYLTKPIDAGDLILAIKNVYRRKQVMEEEITKCMDSLRHEIVGVLQHEFRTPLTYVLTFAQYIKTIVEGEFDGSLDELQVAADGVLEGGTRLQSLIESFLLLSTLQNQTVSVEEMSPVPVQILMQDAVAELQTQASEAKLQIIIEESDEPELIVTCDQELVSEAVKRLLDNAIRYSDITSHYVWLSTITDNEGYIGIRIRDEGTGIPAATAETLSKPFAQGDRTDRTEPGAGISLALSQHIAELHSGYIEIESTEDIGTTVTLWLAKVDLDLG